MYKRIADLNIALQERQVKALDLITSLQYLEIPFQIHPLGFISCTFLREGTCNARLHIWPLAPQKAQSTDTQIHDHIFSFTSWVLLGGIVNTKLTPNENGNKYAIYSTSYSEDKSILQKSDRSIRLTPNTPTLHLTGDKYTVNSGEFHKSERAGSSPAVTVLITDQTKKTSPFVAGPIDGPSSYEYQRSSLSNLELEKLIFNLKREQHRDTGVEFIS